MAPLRFNFNPPAGKAALAAVGQGGEAVLPPDYFDFLTTRADGGEGFLGEAYVILWRLSELAPFNIAYEVERNVPGLLFFGSNGGGEALAFDLRSAARPVVEVPFVGMELENVRPRANTFTDFLGPSHDPNVIPSAGEAGHEGKEIWEIQPVLFGGSPVDPANKTIVTRQQHIELVRYWSSVLREARKNFSS